MNGSAADFTGNQGLTTQRRLVIPFTVSLVWQVLLSGVHLVRLLGSWAGRYPVSVCVLGGLALAWVQGWAVFVVVVVSLVAGGVVWARLGWASFHRRVLQTLLGLWRWVSFYGWRWYPALDGCALTRVGRDQVVYVPRIHRVTSTGVVDTLELRLLHGHTPQDLAEAGEGLRHAFDAHRVTVTEVRPGRVLLRVYARDPLVNVVAMPDVNASPVPDLNRLPVALAETGAWFDLGLSGTHVLIAGATGAGKGSVLWSLLRALAGSISSGVVAVTGLDPKGGMELFPGRALFAHYADQDPEEMLAALEDAVARMQARRARLRAAGVRKHTPSRAEPFEVVLIDELAFLTAYQPDKRIRESVKAALSVLLSQGRAVGFCVVAALQDPRKEVLSFRDLFPTRIALRLGEDSHVDMVLGDGALELGAACHLIPASLPGTGYVYLEGTQEPVRIRFPWVPDDAIVQLAAEYPAPVAGPAALIDLAAVEDQAGSAVARERQDEDEAA